MFTHAFRALLAAGRGDATALEAAANQVEALAEDMPQQPLPRAIVLRARAEAALWAGEPATALTHAAQADHPTLDALAHLASLALQARAVADLSELARRHGRAPRAMPQPVEAQAGVVSTQLHARTRAFAATIEGERSRRRGSREAGPWRQAVTGWEAAADPYGAAYSRLRLAHALLDRRTGRREAGMHLQEALRAASLLAARPLLGAVTDLATAARLSIDVSAATGGRRPEHGTPGTGADLTPREREVLPLLAAGRTNVEIADVLIISPRTVGVHVSRILRKLGAARRTEAADIARRQGLVDS